MARIGARADLERAIVSGSPVAAQVPTRFSDTLAVRVRLPSELEVAGDLRAFHHQSEDEDSFAPCTSLISGGRRRLYRP